MSQVDVLLSSMFMELDMFFVICCCAHDTFFITVSKLYHECSCWRLILSEKAQINFPDALLKGIIRRHSCTTHAADLFLYLISCSRLIYFLIIFRFPLNICRSSCLGSVQPMEADVPASASGRPGVSHSSDRSSASQAASHYTSTSSSGSSSAAYSAGNPYMSKHMYSSSFMSTEGSQSIQSLIGVQVREELGRSSLSAHAYPQVTARKASKHKQNHIYCWLCSHIFRTVVVFYVIVFV